MGKGGSIINLPEIGMAISKWLVSLATHRKDQTDFEMLSDHLNYHHSLVKRSLHQTHRHAKRLFRKHKLTFNNLKSAGTKAAAGAALASTLFVSPAHSGTDTNKLKTDVGHTQAQIPPPPTEGVALVGPDNPNPSKMTQAEFGEKIKEIMKGSQRDGKLSTAQYQQIKDLLRDQIGVEVSNKTNDGFELNKHYGYNGREQHLPTHAGDKAKNHLSPDDPTAIASGVTPGRGAWGYVAPAEEKWYVVGQTFLSEQFGTPATKGLGGQRYIVIEIPEDANGNYTMVARGALWDAGPGRSTGKVFGAAPEFFHHVGPAAARSAKFKAIMLPEVGERKPVNELGPLNDRFKTP